MNESNLPYNKEETNIKMSYRIACPHCQFLKNTYDGGFSDSREYWRFTEVFCYLHGNKDECDGYIGE